MKNTIRRGLMGWIVWAVLAGSLHAQTQSRPPVLAGAYICEGQNLDGSSYSIPTEVVVQGQAVLMTWGTQHPQEQRLYGLGMVHRGVLAVAFRDVAGQVTGIVVYDMIGNILDGYQMVFGAIDQSTPEHCRVMDTKVASRS